MNQTIQTILSRRSIRAYQDQPVPNELLNQIIQCGLFAATARGMQSWHFTVVTNREVLREIVAKNREIMCANGMEPPVGYDNFHGAPCVLLISGDEHNRFSEVDCANATENMALAAHSLGLGSCYIASIRPTFEQDTDRSLHNRLGVPQGYRVLLALAIGYAAMEPDERVPRLPDTVNFVK